MTCGFVIDNSPVRLVYTENRTLHAKTPKDLEINVLDNDRAVEYTEFILKKRYSEQKTGDKITMPELRPLTANDADALMKLRAAAFSIPAERGLTSWVLDNSLGAFENGRLAASIFLKPLTINFCGSALSMYGVGGVATMPLSRRGGYIRKLFGLAAEKAAENDVAIGMLYPFSYYYYRQFGYERLDPRVSLTLPLASMDDFPRNADGELYDGSQKEALLSVYNRYAAAVNLMTYRENDADFSADPENSLKYTYLHRSAAGYDGYVTVQYRPDCMMVQELVYTSPEALRGLLGMLRMFEGQRANITFVLPGSSPVIDMLSRYKVCQYAMNNGPMGRIYDTARLLRSNLYPASAGHFTLTVHDTAPLCGGTFSVEYYKGAAEVRPTDAPADIETDCAAFSRIVLSGKGYSAQELPFLNGVAVNEPARAEDFALSFPRRMTDHMAHY